LKNFILVHKRCVLNYFKLKTKANEQESEIAKLKSRIEELESEGRNYLVKIGSLRDTVDTSQTEINQTKTATDKTIKQMGLELRMLRQENEKLLKRERDLMDFRESVAKKCGLNISLLNVADLDILSRIEYVLAPMQTIQTGRAIQLHSMPITQISNCCAICRCLVDNCKCNVNKHYAASESNCRHSQEVSSSSNYHSTGYTYHCTKN
jgi:predicted RNase H-like nuclease (RuvC/YqgF family)